MPKINFSICTPEREVYSDEVDQITLPTTEGEVTILPNHLPLVCGLKPGEARVVRDGSETIMAVSTGFVVVKPGSRIMVLADTAERAEELELEKIEQAKKKAEELLEQKRDLDEVAFADAAAALERELARLKVARKKYRGAGREIKPE
ncbi:ATP synthase F1 subunit epsilon [Patescibacteria group bacterium]|nr:ATP synthase F1 subunit epsilon [Patescibacteria group bacterium]MBU1921634.1 ATP synthase F1 subunit epsilon [Patescibacteria group bacterium]